MLGSFNKEQFAALLKRALGSRSAYRYSQEVNVSRNHISLLVGQKAKTPPTPETIKKLAEKAENGITYEQLMMAAGHVASASESEALKQMVEDDIAAGRVKKFSDIAPPELAKEFESLGYELVSLIHENEMTIDELRELLVMLRALKTKREE